MSFQTQKTGSLSDDQKARYDSRRAGAKPEVTRVRTGNAMTRTCSLRRRRTVGPIASKFVEQVREDVDSTVEKFGRDPPRRNRINADPVVGVCMS